MRFFLQAIRLRYLHPDSELQSFAVQVIDMLHTDGTVDAQALVCFTKSAISILYTGIPVQHFKSTFRSTVELLYNTYILILYEWSQKVWVQWFGWLLVILSNFEVELFFVQQPCFPILCYCGDVESN